LASTGLKIETMGLKVESMELGIAFSASIPVIYGLLFLLLTIFPYQYRVRSALTVGIDKIPHQFGASPSSQGI
jgi:hypothetical protein